MQRCIHRQLQVSLISMKNQLAHIWLRLSGLGKGLVVLFIILVLLGIMAPNISGPNKLIPFGPNQSIEQAEYLSPWSSDSFGRLHIIGTDRFGRDVLVRVLYGTRTALLVGVGVVLLSFLLALVFGVLAGFFGNRSIKVNLIQLFILLLGSILMLFYLRYGQIAMAVFILSITIWLIFILRNFNLKQFYLPIDSIIMKSIEVIKTVPGLFIILSLFAIFSQASIVSLIVILGLISWPAKARLLRAEILKAKNQDFMITTQVLGLSKWRTVVYHLLPNVISPLVIASCYTFTGAILVESTLSFLNVGLPQDIPSWGGIMRESRDYFKAWWLALFPGLLLFLSILTLNIVVDALNDA